MAVVLSGKAWGMWVGTGSKEASLSYDCTGASLSSLGQ